MPEISEVKPSQGQTALLTMREEDSISGADFVVTSPSEQTKTPRVFTDMSADAAAQERPSEFASPCSPTRTLATSQEDDAESRERIPNKDTLLAPTRHDAVSRERFSHTSLVPDAATQEQGPCCHTPNSDAGTPQEQSSVRRFDNFFDAYDCDYWWLSTDDREPWFQRPPHRSSGPPGWEKWALDVPPVPTLDYQQLRAMTSKSEQTKSDMCQGLDWCTDLRSFESRLRPGWVFSSRAHRSKDFEGAEEQLLRDGYTSPISRSKIKCAIRGFAVPKVKKRKRRAVLDGRAVNEGMKEVPHVRLPSQSDIDECVLKYNYFVELDGTGWFHQFALGEGIPAYFAMQFGSRTYQWNRMPMGWAYSVWIAQKTTEFLADFELPNGVRIVVYIDNVYVFGMDKDSIDDAVRVFLDRCKLANAQFSVTTPLTHAGVVLGMEVELQRKTVRLPENFVEKIMAAQHNLDGLFNNESVHTRLLWKLFGCLQWGARVLHVHMYKYPRWSAWLSHRAGQLHSNPSLWDRGCRIWPKALNDLARLCADICANWERTIRITSTMSRTVFTDASDVGYGISHLGGRTFGRRWTSTMTRHTIALRELYGSVEGVKDTVAMYPDAEHIHLVGDNTNVIAWIKKRKAPSFYGNRLLNDLFAALGARTLSTEWIPSADNPADAPSRSRDTGASATRPLPRPTSAVFSSTPSPASCARGSNPTRV